MSSKYQIQSFYSGRKRCRHSSVVRVSDKRTHEYRVRISVGTSLLPIDSKKNKQDSNLMCGILLAEGDVDHEVQLLIRNRGLEFHETMHINGIVVVSSVLSIREPVKQPVVGDSYLLLYNGEIYNGELSDTNFLRNIVERVTEDPASDNDRCAVNEIYRRINEYENEMAVVLMMGDVVYFMKDDVGRRSLGYSLDPFLVSSVGYDNEIDPMCIYCYNIKNKELCSWEKRGSRLVDEYMQRIYLVDKCLSTEKYACRYKFLDRYRKGYDAQRDAVDKDKSRSDASLIDEFGMVFRSSLRRRITPGNICVFFSGGVDSMALAVFLHHVADPGQEIYLINTAFTSSFDRRMGERGFVELCSRFKERAFIFVRNDVGVEEVRNARNHIYKLIYPKTGKMDFNIGATLFFTARESKKYSKVAYLGSGADELFGGYNRYKKDEFRDTMFFDLFTISSHNLCRDDRVVSDNQVECRFPFLDSEVIHYSLNVEDRMLVNKLIIRGLLKVNGFENASEIPKKAMQYGSGMSKIERSV